MLCWSFTRTSALSMSQFTRETHLYSVLTRSRACIIDYFPRKRVPKTRAAAHWALRIATVGLGVALYSFETNDVGITELVARLWHA